MNALTVSAFAWRNRGPLALLCLALAAWSAVQLASVSVSNSLEDWYPGDDPELLNYREFRDTYGNDEIVVAAISSEHGFIDESAIEIVAALTDALLDVDGIANVTSLVTVPQTLAEARARLLSADAQTTALVLQMMSGEQFEARRSQTLSDIRNTLESFGFEPRLAGYGVIFDGLNEASTKGTSSLLIYAHGLMVLLLAVCFRRPGPVVVTLIAVGVATLWTMGLYAGLGNKLNMITMVLPTLVLVIGIADCVHILRSVARQKKSLAQRERVIQGLAEVLTPCALTTATTAAGFLALTISNLPIVQTLGCFGAVGMVAAFFASVIVCTAGLSWTAVEPRRGTSRLDLIAARISGLGTRSPRRVIAAFGLLAVAATLGISRLETDTNSIEYLDDSHRVRRDSSFIESTLGAYAPIEFTVRADEDILRPENLDAIQRWQLAVTQMEEIGWSWSLLDTLAVSRQTRPSAIPAQSLRRKIERLQSFSPAVTAALLKRNSELRISFGAPIMSAASVHTLTDKILGQASLPDNLRLRPAGYSRLYTRIVDTLVWSQVHGFGLAILLILILLGVALRSWRRTLLALPANAFPVALTLGVMGFAGIPLDVATATIATVILGLVVDDSVHMLRPKPGSALRAALEAAARRCGGTLLTTSIVLASGLLVLALADIRSVAWFGALTSFAVIAAILTDLLLLPALASVWSPKNASSGRSSGFPYPIISTRSGQIPAETGICTPETTMCQKETHA